MKLNSLSKLVAIAVMAIAITAVSLAQTSGPSGGQLTTSKPAQHGRHPIVAALAKLNLAPKQKSQIEGMLKQRRADNKAFRKTNQGNLPALKAHNKQETRAFVTSLKSVLTQSQFQQFQADLRTLKGKGSLRAKRGAIGGTPPARP
jgi:Spy/CpxP family protein refolding chaperone